MASKTEPTVTVVETQKKEEEEEESAAVAVADDEDTGAQVAPIVQLQEVAVTTGEENEDVLLDLKAKLYRFDKEGSQWKERGAGTVKLLKHKTTGRVRLVMRQSKTLKICANHFVLSSINVQEHAGNEKSCVWQASDFADGELKNETFCIRFASVENCKSFRENVEEVAGSQAQPAAEVEEVAEAQAQPAAEVEEVAAAQAQPAAEVVEVAESQAQPAAESEEGTAAANLIEKLSVGSEAEEKKN